MCMLRNEVLAQEDTQEIFLNIWLKVASFNAGQGQPRSWIMSVSHHEVVGLIHSRRQSTVMTDPTDYETLYLMP